MNEKTGWPPRLCRFCFFGGMCRFRLDIIFPRLYPMPMATSIETVIIGAGPGGLACAEKLAARGREVMVLERNRTVGKKVCAGGIPYHALEELSLPPELIEGSFARQHIVTPRRRVILDTGPPAISTINREALGRWMRDKAESAGASFRRCLVREISGRRIRTSKGEFRCRYLVGADGSTSIVRRSLKLPANLMGAGLQYTLPRRMPHMEWHLDPTRFASGYAWVFPHRRTTSVGIYAERGDLRPGLLKKRLRHWLDRQGIDTAGCQPEAALVNIDYQGWNFGDTFLVGDAAGLASAFTGEGIFPAIVSGEAVARTITDPGYDAARLEKIIRQHRRHLKMQQFFTGNKLICQIALEMIVLALKIRLLDFSLLEMY